MALTGTGIRIGSVTGFGVGENFPRALASDGTQVILFGSRKGYLLDPATGAATEIGSIDNFGRSESQCRSATYHNNQFVFWGNSRKTIYNYDPTDGTTSDAHGNPLTIQNTNTNPDLWGIASLGDTLWALDRPSAKLYTVDLTQNEIVPVGDATDYGLVGSPNIQGFTAFGNELIGVSTGLDQLVRFDQTTGVATLISANSLPDSSSEALVGHNGQLFMAGSAADALFRLYDVLWNETIADLEVDEGDDATWSLADVSQDAASFALQGTPPSWLSVSGTGLVATTAPDVTADTNNDVTVRATRDGINVDKTLRVVVRNTMTTPPPPAALSFGAETIAAQALVVGTAVNLTLPQATGGTETTTYSLSPTLPSGVTFTAGTRVLSGTPTGRFTSATFTYTATNGTETVTLTFTIVVTATAISFASVIANQAWIVGTAVNLTLPTADGGVGSLTYSLSPALPSGVTFTAATRALAGNPTATATIATYTYTVTDSEGVTQTTTFTVVVTASAISFASVISNQAWIVGTAVAFTLPTASGGVGAFTYSLTGTLPTGATFVAGTRILSGTPTGRFTSATFTYTATDAEGVTQTQTFTIVVTANAIVFSPTSFANQGWVVGTAVALTLPSGSGGVGTLTPSLTGTLPSGVTFTAGTRALAGNPSAVFTSATFTYTMTDAEGETAEITFTIVVTAAAVALSFASTIANQALVVGTAVSLTLPSATGGTGTITYSLSPTTPAGVAFTAATRVLAGTPTGRFTSATFTYTATDGDGTTVELTFAIVVTAVTITFASTVENQIYDIETAIATLTLPQATGGVGTLSYSLSPTLPDGLSRSNFAISGTPTEKFAVATFTWRVTDGESVSVTVQFSIRVQGTLADPHPVTVLPLPSTLLEKALVEFYEYRQQNTLQHEDEIPIRHLWNPDTCQEPLLVYLACAMSIDAVSVQFSETQLRQLIRDAYQIHRRKGTVQSLKDVIAALGYTLNRIEEGVASTPAVPATDWARYRLVMDTALSVVNANNLKKLIEGAAPVSRELVEIAYDQANAYDNTIRYDGTHNYGRIIV